MSGCPGGGSESTCRFHSLPITEQCLEIYLQEQEKDSVCALIREFTDQGGQTEAEIVPYWRARGALTVCKQILLFAERIVILKSLQKETLQKIHAGHHGIERCQVRVAALVASVNGLPKWCNNVLCV